MSRRLLLPAALLLLQACEKIDISLEEEGEQTTVTIVTPLSTGRGTQEAPYTVRQILDGEEFATQPAWYIGYAVGSTHSTMQNALWEANTIYTSNILLSADSLCTDVTQCVPVELKTTALQKSLSLHHNPEGLHQCVVVYGRCSLYFRVNGIRDLQQGYWLPGLDLSTIAPTDWEETEHSY